MVVAMASTNRWDELVRRWREQHPDASAATLAVIERGAGWYGPAAPKGPDGPAHAKMLRLSTSNDRRLRNLARGIPPFAGPTLADLNWIGSKRPTPPPGPPNKANR